jgi:ABC-type branched-subunit amino acid transport system ATPase component
VTPRLEVRGVSKRFGGVQALRDVTLGVEPGTLTAVLGPNGAGKTTLFDVVSGLTRPDGGTVRFGDADLTRLPPHRIAAAGIGRTFQIARLFPGLSVLDNVLIGVTFGRAGLASASARRRLGPGPGSCRSASRSASSWPSRSAPTPGSSSSTSWAPGCRPAGGRRSSDPTGGSSSAG